MIYFKQKIKERNIYAFHTKNLAEIDPKSCIRLVFICFWLIDHVVHNHSDYAKQGSSYILTDYNHAKHVTNCGNSYL